MCSLGIYTQFLVHGHDSNMFDAHTALKEEKHVFIKFRKRFLAKSSHILKIASEH